MQDSTNFPRMIPYWKTDTQRSIFFLPQFFGNKEKIWYWGDSKRNEGMFSLKSHPIKFIASLLLLVEESYLEDYISLLDVVDKPKTL